MWYSDISDILHRHNENLIHWPAIVSIETKNNTQTYRGLAKWIFVDLISYIIRYLLDGINIVLIIIQTQTRHAIVATYCWIWGSSQYKDVVLPV